MTTAIYAEAARRLLDAQPAGAAETARACQDLVEFLARFIGNAGAAALFDRSLVLTRREYSWLAAPGAERDASLWSRLADSLDGHPPDADAASIALVGGFIRLFATFVGARLAFEILHQHRRGAFPRSTHEDSI